MSRILTRSRLTQWLRKPLPLVLVAALTVGVVAQSSGPFSLSADEYPTFLVAQAFFQQTAWRDTPHRRAGLEERLGIEAGSEPYRLIAESARLAGRIQIEPPPPELLTENPDAWSEAQDRNLEDYVRRLAVHYADLLNQLDATDYAPENLNSYLVEARASGSVGSSGAEGISFLKELDVLFMETVAKHYDGSIPEGRE